MNKIRENSCVFVAKNLRVRGSALIMAIVSTTLLFIIGSLFLLSSRTYKQTTASADAYATEDAAVHAVVNRINTVLTEDLFGNREAVPRNMLNSPPPPAAPDSDEYWDYPYTNFADPGYDDDYWLSDLEPEFYDNAPVGSVGPEDYYYWRHISDIYLPVYNTQFGMPPVTSPWDIYYDNTYSNGAHYQWTTDNIPATFYSPYWHRTINSDNAVILPGVYPFQYKPTVATIISEETSTITYRDAEPVPGGITPYPWEWPWGGLADADGDGVSDSRWTKIPDVTSPDGKNIYTAVRIIDNCAMININTAYRDPTNLTTTPGNWDGSRLSHINLDGIRHSSDYTIDVLQQERYGPVFGAGGSPLFVDPQDYANDTQYENDVVHRVLNPNLYFDGSNYFNYTPFDINEELVLRHRFFLRSIAKPRCGYNVYASDDSLLALPHCLAYTFDPTWWINNPGRIYPYSDSLDLPAWYRHSCRTTSYPQYYTIRHITTAYSFDRTIVPYVDPATIPAGEMRNAWIYWTSTGQQGEFGSKVDLALIVTNPNGIYDAGTSAQYIHLLAAAIYLGLPPDTVLNTNQQIIDLAWRIADGSIISPRERLACQLAVNIVDYIDNNNTSTAMTVNTNNYFGFESAGEFVYITRIGVSQYDAAPLGGGEEYHYAIILHNPGTQSVTLDSWTINIGGTNYTFPVGTTIGADGVCAFIDEDNSIGYEAPPSLMFSVTVAESSAAYTLTDGDIITLFDGANRPVDIATVNDITGDIESSSPVAADTRYFWETADRSQKQYVGMNNAASNLIWDSGSDLGSWNGPLGGIVNLETYSPISATKITSDIQTACINDPGDTLGVIGELSSILYLGSMTVGGTDIPIWQCWETFIDNVGYGGAGDISNDITVGRLNSSDLNYTEWFRYLTTSYFSPNNDSVDNDGNDRSDDPANDGEDNNHDGTIDSGDPQEIFANYGEYSELAIPGRININTAPWFVIAQLPWITDPALLGSGNEYKLAQAIVAYRDLSIALAGVVDYSGGRGSGNGMGGSSPAVREAPGFSSITELLNVTNDFDGLLGTYDPWYDIRRLGRNSPTNDNNTGQAPFYATDTATDDLLERDILLHRISNLATVRSDTFTAYIAVRVGEQGPIKRVIAIFDLSNVFAPADKPQLVALQPVPDPR